MNILRVLEVKVLDSSNIDVVFYESITKNIKIENIEITSNTQNVEDPTILELKISDSTLSLKTLPLTAFANYTIALKSTDLYPFTNVNGTSKVFEDGVSNTYSIIGPIGEDNPIKNYLRSYLNGNIYNIDDDNTLVSKYVNGISNLFAKALYDIRQIKNENYLSYDIIDEKKTRGNGSFDRLNEESAYEVLRVSKNPTGTVFTTKKIVDAFPKYPIALQSKSASESLYKSSSNTSGAFNINDLILNLKNTYVTKLTKLTFTILNESAIYNYDIELLGYQILDDRYDKDFSSKYLILSNNQIKLNDKILSDEAFDVLNIFKIEVEYEYKDLGVYIDSSSLSIDAKSNVSREVLPPILNIFDLKKFPIVDNNNNIATANGVTFINPNSVAPHPAFLYEIPFRLNALPSLPGQYSVDYSTGRVYVFGNDIGNDGTGPFPPLASYKYKQTFVSDVDYSYETDLNEVAALPNGNLINNLGNINFKYEQVLVKDIDFKADLHKEILSERIENNIVALNAIKVKNAPITNVFKIYNETSGEIYTVNRWNDNKIYFKYNTPPNFQEAISERISFKEVSNELMFVNNELSVNSLRIFKILLSNNEICASTEDGLGSSFNSSVLFSDKSVFKNEIWYNRILLSEVNLEKLISIGDYQVDYDNGIVYVAVSTTQINNIGVVNYKINSIKTENKNVTSVSDIYYQISPLENKGNKFSYLSFDSEYVVVDKINVTDELFLNGDITLPYQIYNNQIGAFVDSEFTPGVYDKIKSLRSIYEFKDLTNNKYPLNFALSQSTNFDQLSISVGSIDNKFYQNLKFDGANYYVDLDVDLSYISDNIVYEYSVKRLSDGLNLWDDNVVTIDSSGANKPRLILSGINSPQLDDLVLVTYSFSIKDFSKIVLDYNKGEFYIDYVYLADEILISYEYGDNVLDFRESYNIPANTDYYVSYRVGALRNALLNNFSTLINVPELSTFDTDLNRERYRDSISAALASFIQGPTITAIKNIGKTISHVEPEIIESSEEQWSLGNSLLYPEKIQTTGSFNLLPAKYGNGAFIDDGNSVFINANANVKLNSGTFETWIVPNWNGLDNNSDLEFTITQDGYAIDNSFVFIGKEELHPSDEVFTINKNNLLSGTPNTNKDGLFIYYDKDPTNTYDRWYVRLIDGYVSDLTNYKIKITSNGNVYDLQTLNQPQSSGISIFTGVKNANISILKSVPIDESFTFISDQKHFIFDLGKDKDKSRLSIFKDAAGYLVLRVFDSNKTSTYLSANISDWVKGQPHHIAAAWKINTINKQDELHLFIDGKEVPNNLRFGQKVKPYLHQKYNTISKEQLIGEINKDIVGSTDLKISLGSNVVTSLINFSSYSISPGDLLYIEEVGFNEAGYTIASISGQQLTLDTVMTTTAQNLKFSVNKTSLIVKSEIGVYKNIDVITNNIFLDNIFGTANVNEDTVTLNINAEVANVKKGYTVRFDSIDELFTITNVVGSIITLNQSVSSILASEPSTIYSNEENVLLSLRAETPDYYIDNTTQNVLTIRNGVKSGDLILLNTYGVNFNKVKNSYYIWSDGVENIIRTTMPSPISLDGVKITKVILEPTIFNTTNGTISGAYTSNNIITNQPSSEMRSLSCSVSGNNIDFTNPAYVTIYGDVNETILINNYGVVKSANKFSYIDFIVVTATPINPAKNVLTLSIEESDSITSSDSAYFPTINYSYYIAGGNTLSGSGNKVVDDMHLFSQLHVDNYLFISSPYTHYGYYKVLEVSEDRKILTIDKELPDFNNGVYQILKTTDYRSGLQNGLFTFERDGYYGEPFYLTKGKYNFEYFTYLSIPFDLNNSKMYFGSNIFGDEALNGVIDQVKIYSVALSDLKTGELTNSSSKSITKDFNSLKALNKDSDTLVLINFDTFPFTNDVDFYTINNSLSQITSAYSVNDNFKESVILIDKPIVLSNDGLLDVSKEGTVEFWMSPLLDTGNDPAIRYYFDASSTISEAAISATNNFVKVKTPIERVLSVTLEGDNKDYFLGGRVEIDTQRAIQEESVSINQNTVVVSKKILQVISVKIAGDFTNKDYFADGSISQDKKTIFLGNDLPSSNLQLIITYQPLENNNSVLNTQVIRLNKKLPYQNSNVVVKYIPKGMAGDRISIYKDEFGYVNFSIIANQKNYTVRGPTRWTRNTWHRIKASYKINSKRSSDEMRLFLDGYNYTDVTIGQDLIFGEPFIIGSVNIDDGYKTSLSIKFKDSVNDIYIGSEYNLKSPMFGIIDNLRISNISRPLYKPYGEALDVNWSGNNSSFPVTEDLYTTYLLDSNYNYKKNLDFSKIKNRYTGQFDFTINVFDSFGIIDGNTKVTEILEKLIKILKPANSKAFIKYIT